MSQDYVPSATRGELKQTAADGVRTNAVKAVKWICLSLCLPLIAVFYLLYSGENL